MEGTCLKARSWLVLLTLAGDSAREEVVDKGARPVLTRKRGPRSGLELAVGVLTSLSFALLNPVLIMYEQLYLTGGN